MVRAAILRGRHFWKNPSGIASFLRRAKDAQLKCYAQSAPGDVAPAADFSVTRSNTPDLVVREVHVSCRKLATASFVADCNALAVFTGDDATCVSVFSRATRKVKKCLRRRCLA